MIWCCRSRKCWNWITRIEIKFIPESFKIWNCLHGTSRCCLGRKLQILSAPKQNCHQRKVAQFKDGWTTLEVGQKIKTTFGREDLHLLTKNVYHCTENAHFLQASRIHTHKHTQTELMVRGQGNGGIFLRLTARPLDTARKGKSKINLIFRTPLLAVLLFFFYFSSYVWCLDFSLKNCTTH